MKRSILFDTETTGLDPATGDRVIEIAALELIDDLPTGESFHVLINPERDVPPEASRVHGFTLDDLLDKPKFAEIADGFLAFIGEDEMIAHNAPFDFGFINAELKPAANSPLIVRAWSIRLRWPRSAIRVCPIRLMHYADAMTSIFRRVPLIMPCWTANCFPKSILNSWGVVSVGWAWPFQGVGAASPPIAPIRTVFRTLWHHQMKRRRRHMRNS